MATYFGGATNENAAYLASKTGLDKNVALAWLKNEGQATANPTNPLNILYGGYRQQIQNPGSRFARFPSTQAGLDEAAWLINNSSYDSGVRAAIATKSPALQARAIERSPWAAGNYRGATAPGGISRTWEGLVGQKIDWAKITGAVTTPKLPAHRTSGGGSWTSADAARIAFLQKAISTPSAYPNMSAATLAKYKTELAGLLKARPVLPKTEPVPRTSGGGTIAPDPSKLSDYPQQLGGFGDLVSYPEGTPLTQKMIDEIIQKMQTRGDLGTLEMPVASALMEGILKQHIGQPWNKALQDTLQGKTGQAAGLAGVRFNPLSEANLNVPDIPGAIGAAVGYVFALALIVLGFWLYTKGKAGQVPVA